MTLTHSYKILYIFFIHSFLFIIYVHHTLRVHTCTLHQQAATAATVAATPATSPTTPTNIQSIRSAVVARVNN